ncbi:MAG: hypothetical protein IKF18_00895 [Erysipelotrichaceae bacterium]|nr:hypothetical protein [Erysipelotrichaceae bacterium]
MSEIPLFIKIQNAIRKLKSFSSFTLSAAGDVSTLKGVLKVPLTGRIIILREQSEVDLNGEISLMNYSFKGFYSNKDGIVSAGLNGKEESFTGNAIDVESIIEGVQEFLGSHYNDLSEDENGVIVLSLKDDATYDLMKQIGFNVSLIDKYLKEIVVHNLRFELNETAFEHVVLTADAKLEGIPVDATIKVCLTDINDSQPVL